MPRRFTGVILAGGQSRRMGHDKAFLPWAGTTLLEHVIETLRPVVDEVIVSVRDAGAFQHLRVRVVEDLVPGAHALGGLYTGLKAAAHPRAFVCACDAPFLNPALVRFLIDQAGGVDLVIPRTAEGLQPLHAVYGKSALPVIEAQLSRRHWDVQGVVPLLHSRVVPFEAICPLDPQARSFLNLNTLAEYEAARPRRF